MEEAENECMHLMTFVEIAQPTAFERIVILFAQWLFYLGFFLLYLVSSPTCRRLRSPEIIGNCRPTRRCAMWSVWYVPMKRITAMSIMGVPASSPASRSDRKM